MDNFALIFLCFAAGIVLRRAGIFDKGAAHAFNRFVIYLSLPALTLRELHKLDLGSLTIWIPLMPWLWFFIAWGILVLINRWLKFPKLILGALILTVGLGNTSFVGFPLLEILFGPHAISTGILVDQGGSFLVASTLGILAAQFYAEKKFSFRHCVQRVFAFPPFLAVLASIPLHFVTFPPAFEHVLDRLALTLVPLALFSVGLQLDVSRRVFAQRRAALLTGLGLKLLVSPLVFLFLYGKSGVLDGEVLRIVLTESAMAPMITAGVIAAEQGLDAETANMMIGLGIPISFVTVPLWKSLFDLLA